MAATAIKICGLTNYADALAAAEAGADMLGFVFADSPRKVAPSDVRNWQQVLPPTAVTVGVFMDQPAAYVMEVLKESRVDRLQLHGAENLEDYRPLEGRIIKRIRVTEKSNSDELSRELNAGLYGVDAVLLDPGAGQGIPFDWALAKSLRTPLRIFLAGGLTPENVFDAICTARPHGVDVSSGVEAAVGKKDLGKIRAFIAAVRTADKRLSAD